ncbi:hypothetical protein H0H81_012358 [Sphagnurus paluster]|uniref:Uncharacterized protein n=1 Tax=Sphagnurus paluster TaxID=117069 RepID=A0A9P7KKU9_9AGAR|nr:hypothetical protein H0H81_012358 [Sphagnurus paluster]
MPLDTVPQEVLEHIALFAATQTNLGPPSGLIPLLLTSRQFYARLSIHTNHHLYACIFAVKFDTRAVQRRLGSACTTPVVLVAELQRRCVHLKLIRTRSEAILKTTEAPDSPLVHQLLSHAYLMMLENEGQNERQLLQYAEMGGWLRDYWFHDRGASRAAAHFLDGDTWVPDTDTRALAMWLFWFLLEPEFTSYAHLLAGAGPSIVQRSMSVRHRQTWKLREHHLLCQGTKDSMESLDASKSAVETGAPLDPGDPLRSFFPAGTQIRETAEGILVLQPNREEVLNYRRAPSRRDEFLEHKKEMDVVQDVIVVGEVDGDRGKWLYRGYIVGDKNANYSGRWRDTLTPVDIQGYEGCFAMSRRR